MSQAAFFAAAMKVIQSLRAKISVKAVLVISQNSNARRAKSAPQIFDRKFIVFKAGILFFKEYNILEHIPGECADANPRKNTADGKAIFKP